MLDGRAVGQERSRNHPHLEKEEVVPALPEVDVRSQHHLSKPSEIQLVRDARLIPLVGCVELVKKKTHRESILKCKVQIICEGVGKITEGGDGGISLYMKFSEKIIALSQDICESLIHV